MSTNNSRQKENTTEREKPRDNLILTERNFKLFWDSMGRGVVYQDVDGKIILMNPSAERILGKSPDDFLGKTSVDVEHDSIREDGSAFPGIEHPSMIALRTGKEVNNVVMGVFNPREKAYRWINISATPIIQPGESKPYQVYTIFEDITERKQAEEKIKKLYKKEKSQRLKLQEEAKIKNLFIDVLAHELRTPLSSILACSEMLQDAPAANEFIKKRLSSNINSGANALAKRLDELLDVARFSKGIFELKMQLMDTHKFIKDTVEKFKPALAGKEQVLKVSISGDLPAIVADQSRLEQVIINLLSNASKYSPEKSSISLTARVKNKNLLVEVADEGVGIAEKDKDEIFRAYHRIGGTGRTSGTGLGLYISKQIVEAHHGKIWFTSQPGKGSIFSLSIPIDTADKKVQTQTLSKSKKL